MLKVVAGELHALQGAKALQTMLSVVRDGFDTYSVTDK